MQDVSAVAHIRFDDLIPASRAFPVIVQNHQNVTCGMLGSFVPRCTRALSLGNNGIRKSLHARTITCINCGDNSDIGAVLGPIQPQLLAFFGCFRSSCGVEERDFHALVSITAIMASREFYGLTQALIYVYALSPSSSSPSALSANTRSFACLRSQDAGKAPPSFRRTRICTATCCFAKRSFRPATQLSGVRRFVR